MSWSFEVEHHILASPDRVFQVWLDGNDRRGPWVGDGDRKIDGKIGGDFSWDDRNFSDLGGGGGCWGHWGKFLEIDNTKIPYLIEYTWRSQWTDNLDTRVRVEFSKAEDDDRFTKIKLCMAGLPDNRHGYEHKNAWIRILGEMGAKFWGNAEEKDRVSR